MRILRVLAGAVLGVGIPFTSLYFSLLYFSPLFGLHPSGNTAFIAASIAGVIGFGYSCIAFDRCIYGFGPFSILGYLLDMSWSLLNTAVSLLVWLPACSIAGGVFTNPDDESRRSGVFVYPENPRGGNYRTTLGTVIAGGWNSHEEMHVWQARLFGPLYLPTYGLSLLLNLLFFLFTGKVDHIGEEAYHRVVLEDWAYSAGVNSGAEIKWLPWIFWFFISLAYVGCAVLVVKGACTGSVLAAILAACGLVAYSLTRTFSDARQDSNAHIEPGALVTWAGFIFLVLCLAVSVFLVATRTPAQMQNAPSKSTHEPAHKQSAKPEPKGSQKPKPAGH